MGVSKTREAGEYFLFLIDANKSFTKKVQPLEAGIDACIMTRRRRRKRGDIFGVALCRSNL